MQADLLTGRRTVPHGKPLTQEAGEDGLVVESNPGHELLVAVAASGIAVQRFDQFGYRAEPVADDKGRLTFRHRQDAPSNHQYAMVPAVQMPFHDDAPAVSDSSVKGPDDLLRLRQGGRHSASMIGVQRLDRHKSAEASRCGLGGLSG